ncbi:histidine phosphatase family protein [Litorilituus sediminis]|uniref:Histidine phosphatase family protein n=1 Tax=Litorilituus sediminis TaxID=718192 RepID=A0A4P6P9L0_9GAMM|nr:histidine phosphatase family protein [Litorilituus sediminis]QBG36227.1 histidine phosphatase family protein [Litorilituus sediminis]
MEYHSMEIVLLRHGKPNAAIDAKRLKRLSAGGYAHWVRQYNKSLVHASSRPSVDLAAKYQGYYQLASDLPRAMQSAEIATNRAADEYWPALREMNIPRYKIPLKLKAYHWLVLTRILWMLGVKRNMSDSVESFTAAKQRANQAATKLADLAASKQKIIAFGHGYTNRYIRKALIAQGWQLVYKSNDFWGETCLTKATEE